MSMRDDAMFLAGFVYGSGSNLHVNVLDVLDRVMESQPEEDRIEITGPPIKLTDLIPDVYTRELAAKISEAEKTAVDSQGEQTAPAEEIKPVKKERKKHNISPHQREVMRQRMIAMRARQKAEKAGSIQNTPVSIHVQETCSQTEQIDEQAEDDTDLYAQNFPAQITTAKPTPPAYTLTDDDWPDVSARRKRGATPKSLAADYDVEEDDMLRFIARMEDRESGNSNAP